MLPKGYSTVTDRCMYQADVGLICPMTYFQPETGIQIQPFFMLDLDMQNSVVSRLEKEWNEIDHDFIDKNWSQGGDILYVAFNFGDAPNNIIGTIAVDRKGFTPFISTVYVCPMYRGFGYSKILITFAETFIKEVLHFKESHLWCEEAMLDFYFNLGYSIEKSDDKYILSKKLI